jgi:hypothetical protein
MRKVVAAVAVLEEVDRVECWREWMQQNDTAVSIAKGVLRAIVDVIDDYLDNMLTNRPASSLNAAINAAGGSSLTAKQKLRLVDIIARRRFAKG